MILANFSLGWFTTIPGMLITGGVLLLVIALVIFVATSNKKVKKDENTNIAKAQEMSVEEAIVATTPAVDTPVTTTDVAPAVEPETTTSLAQEQTAIESANAEVPQQMPATPGSMATTNQVSADIPSTEVTSMNEPLVVEQPINETPVAESVSAIDTKMPTTPPLVEVPETPEIPIVEDASVGVSSQTSDTVASSTETVTTPQVEPFELPVEQATPMVTEQQVDAPSTFSTQNQVTNDSRPIYGGNTPVIPNLQVEEEPRPIYGGANPLDNTQSIPAVNLNIPTVEPVPTQVDSVPSQSEAVPKVAESAEVATEEPKKEEAIESLF